VIFSLICFGWRAPPDLHFLLTGGLPVIGDVGQPIKYWNFFVLLSLVLSAAVGAEVAAGWARSGWPRAAAWAAVGALLLLPAAQNRTALAERFALPLPAEPKVEYQQVLLVRDRADTELSPEALREVAAGYKLRDHLRPPAGTEFVNARRGVGTINWYGTLLLPEHAVARFFVTGQGELIPNRRYRGEAWVVGETGRVLGVTVKPNTVDLEVRLDVPGRVVVNQNHLPGFEASVGRVASAEGLLAVDLPAGEHSVRLTYRPKAQLVGLAVSAASFVCLLGALLVPSAARRRRQVGGRP
jgi:hypothetical protein